MRTHESLPLTPRQQRFVDAYALCGNAAEAARRAGYSVRTAGQIGQENLKKPAIAAALAARQAMYADELQVTKEDVVGGLLRAIGLARAQENPAAMIQGCAALAKLCGFYAPERQQVELSSDTTTLQAKFVAMSDAQLLAIAGGG